MKSKSARLATLVLLVLSALVLSSSVNASPAEREQPVAAQTELIPIRWFVGLGAGTDPSQIATQQQVVADFNASQTVISLTVEIVDSSVAVQTLKAQIASGNPPDIVGPVGIAGTNTFHGQWLDLQPLITSTSYDLSDFESEVVSLYDEGSEGLVSIPFAIYPSFIYYNKDLFDQAGLVYPPHTYGQPYTDPVYGGAWDMDKLAEISKRLTLDNLGRNATDPAFDTGNIAQFGYHTQWTDLRGEATLFGAGSFVDVNGDAQIPAHWQASLEWHSNAMWGPEPFMPNDPYANSAPFNGNPFDSDKLAMAHVHLWYTCCLGNVTNWDIAATPAYSGTITSKIHADSFRILQDSQYPDEAFQVLTYLLGTAAPTLHDAYGSFPARLSERAGALSTLGLAYPGVDWDVMVDSIPYLDNPNHEGYLPNYQKALDRIEVFHSLYRGTPGLNLNFELDTLRDDLQFIFHEQNMFLPLVIRG